MVTDKKDFLDFIQYNFGMYTDGNIDEDDFLQAVEEYMFGVSKPRGYNLNGEFIERQPNGPAYHRRIKVVDELTDDYLKDLN